MIYQNLGEDSSDTPKCLIWHFCFSREAETPISYYVMYTAHWIHCILYAAYCILGTAYCITSPRQKSAGKGGRNSSGRSGETPLESNSSLEHVTANPTACGQTQLGIQRRVSCKWCCYYAITLLCSALLYSTLLCSALLSLLWSTLLYSTLLYSALLCSALLRYTLLVLMLIPILILVRVPVHTMNIMLHTSTKKQWCPQDVRRAGASREVGSWSCRPGRFTTVHGTWYMVHSNMVCSA